MILYGKTYRKCTHIAWPMYTYAEARKPNTSQMYRCTDVQSQCYPHTLLGSVCFITYCIASYLYYIPAIVQFRPVYTITVYDCTLASVKRVELEIHIHKKEITVLNQDINLPAETEVRVIFYLTLKLFNTNSDSLDFGRNG